MKKRVLNTKLVLKRETIANLTKEALSKLRGGSVSGDPPGDPTDIGKTCYTGSCCKTNDCG
jgi:hypothetical protein